MLHPLKVSNIKTFKFHQAMFWTWGPLNLSKTVLGVINKQFTVLSQCSIIINTIYVVYGGQMWFNMLQKYNELLLQRRVFMSIKQLFDNNSCFPQWPWYHGITLQFCCAALHNNHISYFWARGTWNRWRRFSCTVFSWWSCARWWLW